VQYLGVDLGGLLGDLDTGADVPPALRQSRPVPATDVGELAGRGALVDLVFPRVQRVDLDAVPGRGDQGAPGVLGHVGGILAGGLREDGSHRGVPGVKVWTCGRTGHRYLVLVWSEGGHPRTLVEPPAGSVHAGAVRGTCGGTR